MIRIATSEDIPALLAVAEATGLFSAEELEDFGGMISEQLGADDDSDHVWIADDEAGIVSAAYYAPEQFAGEGVWNLYFIGVHPSEQGKGRGSALMRYIEKDLMEARNARLLLVETSGQNSFEQTRAFYRKNGYEEEARIRDYYRAGDDKIIFRKLLNATA